MDNTNERIKLIQDHLAQSVEDYGDYELAKIDSDDAYWLISTIKQQQQEIEGLEEQANAMAEKHAEKDIIMSNMQQEIERLKEALFEGEANHFQCAPCQHGESQEKILKRYEEALKRIASDETVTFEQTEVIALRALGEIGNLR